MFDSLTTFDSLPIPAGICEIDGTLVAINAASVRLFGRPAAQVVGKKAWDFAPGAEHIWADLVASARRDGSFRGEISIASPNAPVHVHYVVAIREHAGRTFVVIFAFELPDQPTAR
ncbi:MAG TPA: PAS domain-containing protein [Kofleriaceae bacterium]